MILIFAGFTLITFTTYVLLEPERETYDRLPLWFYARFFVKLVYRLIRHRKQGALSLHKDLIYVAGGGADSLVINPKNHRLRIKGVRIDSKNLKDYRSLCGYKPNESGVPVCYAETLFMKGLLLIITSAKFCLAPIGLIHIHQTIKQLEPLEEYLNSAFDLDLTVKEYRQLPRGIECDIGLRLLVNGLHPVWEGTVTLFSRGPASRSGSDDSRSFKRHEEDDSYDEVVDLDVPGNCGVEYAKLSSDWNPFHLYKWTAQLFGFRLPIAHGMWTLSRALAVIQSEGYDLYQKQTEVMCAFKRPLFMPGRAKIKVTCLRDLYIEEGTKLVVEERDTSIPHLKATVKVA